ncbi:MAG TPA: winged helix-turn-helix domain-containing protein [Candidatus Norongarragalinales archaeon]|jgi:DNA-binding transcriptional ArsR family regulator|nr:winged helix-turn-helix domain-containing protein [Candidatus Norongarragalinales archaeon]
MDITLDPQSFKALASDTRVEILKTLKKRRMTASELAKNTGYKVQTVSEHLGKLERAGLVKRHEEGRKWVYHSLTEKGLAIVEPQPLSPAKLWVVLTLSLVMLSFGTLGVLNSVTLPVTNKPPGAASITTVSEQAPPVDTAVALGPTPSSDIDVSRISGADAVLALTGLLLLIYSANRLRKLHAELR